LKVNSRKEKRKLRQIKKNMRILKARYLGQKQVVSVRVRELEMPLFVAKGVLLRVLRNQLARRHLYLGLKTNQTHQGFYMCLGGFHNNLALINLDLQSFYFKRNFRIMLHFLLRNYRFCFISNHIREFFNKAKLVFHYHLVFDY